MRAAGLPTLTNRVTCRSRIMKHARIRHHGQIFNVQVDEQLRVTLPNGEVLQEREVEWLPPAQGTVFAPG